MKYFFLYRISNLIDGKIYIGQTVNPNNRWRKHKSDAKLNKSQTHLSRAIRKFGIDNFIFDIIAQSKSLEGIDEAEISVIKQYNSSDKNFGYNISLGGNGKRIVSQETKDKLSVIFTGRKESQETKDKKSKSMTGKNSGTSNGMFGKSAPISKLNMNQVLEIRSQYLSGELSSLKLSKKYNVSKKTILNIIHNKIYKEKL